MVHDLRIRSEAAEWPEEQDALRAHFLRRAEAVEIPVAPVAAVLDGVRRDRHRRAGASALVLACAAVVAVVTVTVPGLSGTARPEPPAAAPWTVTQVPTAGDLAHDAAWLSRARARAAAASGLTVNHVIFAGHLAEGTALLVATDEGSSSVAANGSTATAVATPSSATAGDSTDYHGNVLALYSPSNSPDDLALTDYSWNKIGQWLPDHLTTEVSMAVNVAGGGRAFVVVPLIPTARLEVSAGVQVGSDGKLTRTWTTVPVRNGAATGRLDAVMLSLPQVRLGAGPSTTASTMTFPQLITARPTIDAITAHRASSWPSRPRPTTDLVRAALAPLLSAAAPGDLAIEPRYSGSEHSSDADTETLAAVVRLRGGGALQVVSAVATAPVGAGPGDGVKAIMVTFSPVPAADADRLPLTWIDPGPLGGMLSFSSGPLDGQPTVDRSASASRSALRIHVFRPAAARIVLRDTGRTACVPGRTLASGTPDAHGLATFNVTIPDGCVQSGAPAGDRTAGTPDQAGLAPIPDHSQIDYSRFVAIAYDSSGHELARAPLQNPGAQLELGPGIR